MTKIGLFKVTQGHRFWHRSKSCINFLLANTTNLYFITHRFGVIAACWSSYHFYDGCLYSPSWFGMNPWTLDCEIWPKTRKITLSCGAQTIRAYRPFRCGSPVRQTDERTDGQIITIAIACI